MGINEAYRDELAMSNKKEVKRCLEEYGEVQSIGIEGVVLVTSLEPFVNDLGLESVKTSVENEPDIDLVIDELLYSFNDKPRLDLDKESFPKRNAVIAFIVEALENNI